MQQKTVNSLSVLVSDCERKTRNARLDFIKGAAIVLMVFCHAIDNSYPAIRQFICLFHMPVFVIAAGYFFSAQKVSTIAGLAGFIVRKIKRIWVPFVVAMSVLVLLHNLFISIGFYTTEPSFLALSKARWTSLAVVYDVPGIIRRLSHVVFMTYREQLGGAMWFMQTIFWVYALCSGLDYVIVKKKKNPLFAQTVISVVIFLLIHGRSVESLRWIGGPRTLAAYGLFHVGVMIRHFDSVAVGVKSRIPYWLPFVLALVSLLLLMRVEDGSLTTWNYRTVVTFLIVSILGWIFLSGAHSIFIKHTPCIADAVAYVGRFTMSIMIFHFLAFKLINLISVYLTAADIVLVARFPVSFETGAWPVLYVVAGVAIPISVSVAYEKTKELVRKHARCKFLKLKEA